MDCKFKILTKDNNTFEILKTKADGFSKQGLIIINAKCEFLEVLQEYDVEILINPFTPEGEVDCFYYNKEIKECNSEILDKFDMKKFEPIIWKKDSFDDIPF